MPSAQASSSFRPWYKEPWPWFVIVLLGSAVTAASTCVYISFRDPDPVVRDDWYEGGKDVNQSIDRDKHAAALALVATLNADDTTGEVTLRLKAKQPQTPATLELKLAHNTIAARDQNVLLTRQADGSYRGTLTSPLKGHYYIDIETQDWRLADSELFPQGAFDIAAGSSSDNSKPVDE